MPNTTISITNLVSNVLTNAYSVTLSSSDSTYGIKNLTTGQVIVSCNTSPLNTDVGVYAYIFMAELSDSYEISWQIVQTKNAEPSYKVETILPYPLNTPAINAVPQQKGQFIQGQNGLLNLDITDWLGNAIDPTSITVAISDPNQVPMVLFTNLPEKIGVGYYSYEFTILPTALVGSYLMTWSYTLTGSPTVYNVYQSFIVAATPPNNPANQNTMYNDGILPDLITLMGFNLCCTQKIPVYNEAAKPSIDNQTFNFSFTNWNQTPAVRIYRNNIIVNNDVIIDYFNGIITFNTPLTQYDRVTCDYTFRWFSDEQLANYLNMALQLWKLMPPYSYWSFNMNNPNISSALVYKATADAIREMIMCLMFQEPRKVFGGDEMADKVIGNLETLKKNYEGDWQLVYKNKIKGPYPSIGIGLASDILRLGGRSRFFRQLFTANPNG